jgi:hypothetical protein
MIDGEAKREKPVLGASETKRGTRLIGAFDRLGRGEIMALVGTI